jgi:hypothetical protein
MRPFLETLINILEKTSTTKLKSRGARGPSLGHLPIRKESPSTSLSLTTNEPLCHMLNNFDDFGTKSPKI